MREKRTRKHDAGLARAKATSPINGGPFSLAVRSANDCSNLIS